MKGFLKDVKDNPVIRALFLISVLSTAWAVLVQQQSFRDSLRETTNNTVPDSMQASANSTVEQALSIDQAHKNAFASVALTGLGIVAQAARNLYQYLVGTPAAGMLVALGQDEGLVNTQASNQEPVSSVDPNTAADVQRAATPVTPALAAAAPNAAATEAPPRVVTPVSPAPAASSAAPNAAATEALPRVVTLVSPAPAASEEGQAHVPSPLASSVAVAEAIAPPPSVSPPALAPTPPAPALIAASQPTNTALQQGDDAVALHVSSAGAHSPATTGSGKSTRSASSDSKVRTPTMKFSNPFARTGHGFNPFSHKPAANQSQSSSVATVAQTGSTVAHAAPGASSTVTHTSAGTGPAAAPAPAPESLGNRDRTFSLNL
jgi:hypothetical protein